MESRSRVRNSLHGKSLASATAKLLLLSVVACAHEEPTGVDAEPIDSGAQHADALEDSDARSQCCELPQAFGGCCSEMPVEEFGRVGGRRRSPAEAVSLGPPTEANLFARFDESGCRIARLNRAPRLDYHLLDDEGCPFWYTTEQTCGNRDVPETGVDAGNDAADELPDATDATNEGSEATADTTENFE